MDTRHIAVRSHFVDYLPDCYDHGLRRLRYAVIRIYHDLPLYAISSNVIHTEVTHNGFSLQISYLGLAEDPLD